MGDKDPDFPDPATEARWIAERLKGEVLLVPDAGHYPQAEFPEIVSPAVVEFARGIAPKTQPTCLTSARSRMLGWSWLAQCGRDHREPNGSSGEPARSASQREFVRCVG
jgi:hypothetical protein